MSEAARLRRASNASDDTESRHVLAPSGNKARSASASPKNAVKTVKVVPRKEKTVVTRRVDTPPLSPTLSDPTVLKSYDVLLQPNLSLNASFSSDCSTDSFHSRASTGRIGSRANLTSRRRPGLLHPERIISKLEKIANDGRVASSTEVSQGMRRCAWVTANTDPCYISFHDEEWGVPIHDDKKLFELLVLSGALAEHTWPIILSKRHIFREIFMDFDPMEVSKLNEKKIIAPGSTARSLLSEPKLRAVIENARLIVKVIAEFGSFDQYFWNFFNHKPIISKFRYPRQVPVKTSKADFISKDLIRRGFRSVGPTVVYTFMQAAGFTNDHLITCYRFEECSVVAIAPAPPCPNENGNPEQELSQVDTDYSFDSCDTTLTAMPAPKDEQVVQPGELELAASIGAIDFS